MIPVVSLLYDLDLKLNKLSALTHQVIPLENKLIALNDAQIKLVKTKLDPNNPLGLGLDAFKKRYEDLENLIERASDHEEDISLTDKNLNEYSADISKLNPSYMFYVDSYITATKGTCTKVIYVNRGLAKHADVLTLLSNTNYVPSFEYADTFCVISNLQISVYTDGTFQPNNIYISYIRYPVTMDYPGYEHFDGTPSTQVDCELNYYLKDELVNLAVEDIAMSIENTPAVEFTEKRISKSE